MSWFKEYDYRGRVRRRVGFGALLGKTLTRIEGAGAQSEAVVLHCGDGSEFAMWHAQDCCEHVRLEEVVGDVDDLIGSPILRAEESTNADNPPGYAESFTWTLYRVDTAKGSVTLRWLGESNGYYGEEVAVWERVTR